MLALMTVVSQLIWGFYLETATPARFLHLCVTDSEFPGWGRFLTGRALGSGRMGKHFQLPLTRKVESFNMETGFRFLAACGTDKWPSQRASPASESLLIILRVVL